MAQSLPSLRALQAFEAVARLDSTTEAAAELNVSQSAISQQLSHLSDQLGNCLYTRQGRKLQLTEKGGIYAKRLELIFQQLRQATEQLFIPEHENLIIINTTTTFSMCWLLSHLMNFYEQYPQYEVHISAPARSINFDFDKEDIVLYGSNFPWQQPISVSDELHKVLLYDDQLCVVSTQDVNKEKYLLTDSLLYRNDWQQWFTSHDQAMPANDDILRFTSFPQALRAAQNGMGLLIARRIFVSDLLQNEELILHEDFVINKQKYHLYIPERKLRQEKVQVFQQWLIKEINNSLQNKTIG